MLPNGTSYQRNDAPEDGVAEIVTVELEEKQTLVSFTLVGKLGA